MRDVIKCVIFFFQAEDGIRDLVRSRGLGDVYKRQAVLSPADANWKHIGPIGAPISTGAGRVNRVHINPCLLYTSDAADERSSVDLGGRRIIKKKNTTARH